MKTNRALFLLLAAGLFASASVCAAADTSKTTDSKSANTKPADAKSAASGTTAATNTTTTNAASLYQAGNYKLRPTEVIGVDVVDDPKAKGDFPIGIDGNVQLPYIQDHPVKVAGLSTSEAAQVITKAYKDLGIFVNPSITVSVRQYVAQQVYFLGEVNKQGPIAIPTGKKLTLVQALNEAGGHTHNAAGTVTITRINVTDGTTQVLKNVDLWGAAHGTKPDVELQEGDTINLGQSILGDVWQ